MGAGVEGTLAPEDIGDLGEPQWLVSVVIPCLNEARSIARCVAGALAAMEGSGIDGEVIVVDNGSTDRSSELGGSLLLIVGAQVVSLGLCAHAYATYFMGERDPWFDRMLARLRLEHGLMLGGAIALGGLVVIAAIALQWIARGFGSLSQERGAIVAATLLVLGVQVIFSSFLLSILGLRRDRT